MSEQVNTPVIEGRNKNKKSISKYTALFDDGNYLPFHQPVSYWDENPDRTIKSDNDDLDWGKLKKDFGYEICLEERR